MCRPHKGENNLGASSRWDVNLIPFTYCFYVLRSFSVVAAIRAATPPHGAASSQVAAVTHGQAARRRPARTGELSKAPVACNAGERVSDLRGSNERLCGALCRTPSPSPLHPRWAPSRVQQFAIELP
ncbi:unnamed protein product, partial [Iphiclides podalirius]